MDSIEKRERIRAAKRRLLAQRQRASLLRGRVVAISLIGFVLLWGVIFAQMATGNDPVLGDSSSPSSGSGRRAHGLGAQPARPAAPDAEEATEPLPPEPLEFELVEPEPVEEEPLVEPEPAPLTSGQS